MIKVAQCQEGSEQNIKASNDEISADIEIKVKEPLTLKQKIRYILKKKPIVLVEGNIGCGKSTLASSIQRTIANEFGNEVGDSSFMSNTYVTYIEEKMDKEALEHLDQFMKHPKEHAIIFQKYMDATRLENMKMAVDIVNKDDDKNGIVILDTGILRHLVFTKVNYEQGNITKDQYDEHISFFQNKHKEMGFPLPDVIFLIDAQIGTLLENIKIRGRDAESTLSYDYLNQLRQTHHECLKWFQDSIHFGKKVETQTFCISKDKFVDPKQFIHDIYNCIQ